MAWYNASWSYRVKVTVLNTRVDADLTDFPVYVDLSTLPAGFHTNVNQTDGRDIRVTKADGTTEVPREVVAYVSALDTGELHFKGDVLNSTDVDFYIYYGNAGATEPAVGATFGRNAVWSNGYQAVFHLQEDPTISAPQFPDSSGNGRNLTAEGSMTSGDSVAGKLAGNAIDFDGSNDALRNSGWTWGGNAVTLSGWNKSRSPAVASSWVGFASSGDRFSTHAPWSDSVLYWDYGGAGGTGRISTSYASYIGAWTYITLVSSGSANTLRGIYLNGSLITSIAGSLQPTSPSNFSIGNAVSNFNNGEVDEVRIADGVRTATWISTEYNNQNSPATFFTIGSQEIDTVITTITGIVSITGLLSITL